MIIDDKAKQKAVCFKLTQFFFQNYCSLFYSILTSTRTYMDMLCFLKKQNYSFPTCLIGHQHPIKQAVSKRVKTVKYSNLVALTNINKCRLLGTLLLVEILNVGNI